MAVEKVTSMVLKVDLQCPSCYKKIKKTLCKFPQIRDQIYNEKANTVEIKVVCCSPEKIRDKLRAKGGKVIQGIEIKAPKKEDGKTQVVVTEKPKDGEKPKDKPKDGEKPKDKPKEGEKPKDKPKEGEKAEKPKADGKGDKPKDGAPKPAEPAKTTAQAAKGPEPAPAHGVPSIFPFCGPTYDAYAAGPYYHGYGFPPPPPPPPQPIYEGYYGHGYAQHGYGHAHGYGNGYGYGRGGYVTRSDCYFSEENPQSCSIM
ncbi:hypothetical protein CDL12_15109 [Handroanthus impetiginosus]|uniref:Uncharacterized protein n=1 Tax=Handroanthus impetiginosus TaxID=429701 RepID=A0A2G9H424_9LAMI|nr:hypothetical protein CDL12_15109 [Handroanthus impetiginosus]